MMKQASLALIVGALVLGACQTAAPPTSVLPAPTERYSCMDGTQLAVQLLGGSASVSVNNAAPVSLPAMGTEGTTFSNGQQTLTVVQGRVSWGLGRAVPAACNVAGS